MNWFLRLIPDPRPLPPSPSFLMGLTYVDATVTGPTDKWRQIQLLVDNGVSYSVLTEYVWQELEIKPQETLDFILADGTKIERRASECKIRLNAKGRHTPVILGEPGEEPLLGVITLENLGYGARPV